MSMSKSQMLTVGNLLICINVITYVAASLLLKKISNPETSVGLQRQVLNYSGNLLFCQSTWYFQKSLYKWICKPRPTPSVFFHYHDNTTQWISLLLVPSECGSLTGCQYHPSHFTVLTALFWCTARDTEWIKTIGECDNDIKGIQFGGPNWGDTL